MNFRPILIKKVNFFWKHELEDIDMIQERDGKIYSWIGDTVMELTETSAKVNWQATLEIRKSDGDVDKFYAGIWLICDEPVKFTGNVFIRVKSANCSVKCEETSDWDPQTWEKGWAGFLCTVTDALNPEKNYLVDEKLTLHIQGIFFAEPDVEEFGGHLGRTLWGRDDRDFIIAVGKEDGPKTEIKIHKLVLMACSPVFDQMLQTDMKGKAQLDIIDFDVEVVQAAVALFYDRNTCKELCLEHLIGLLQFLDNYQVPRAKEIVQRHLLQHIYPNTVYQIGNASVKTNSLTLKEACIKVLNLYILRKVPYENSDSLDKDFAAELVRSFSINDEDPSDDESMSD